VIVEKLLIERICLINFRRAWDLGEELGRGSIVDAATSVARLEFELLDSAGGEFHGLSACKLERLLSDDELVVEGEDSVFRVLKQWYKAQQLVPPLDSVSCLLRCIRWPLLTRQCAEEQVNNDPILSKHPDGWKIVAGAFQDAVYGTSMPRPRAASGKVLETPEP